MSQLLVLGERRRKQNESTREWLLSERQLAHGTFGLPGTLVQSMPDWVALETSLFDATKLPRIQTTFTWLHHFVDSNFACQVPPTHIKASKDEVWRVILEFDRYSEWNPFQRQVCVVESDAGDKSVRLWVNFDVTDELELIPVEKASALSKERLLYVDERPDCCILIYGLDWYIVPTLRVQVVVADGPNSCNYYSYDHFGGWIASFLLRPTLVPKLRHGFKMAARALKRRCELASNTFDQPKS